MTLLNPSPVTPRTPPWTARVAGWSARHRWPVFGLWFVVTIGIFVASLAAGGTNAVEAVSNAERSKFEAGEAYVIYADANATAGQEQAPPSQQFLLIVSSPDRTVDDPAYAADIAAITTRLGAIQSTIDGVAGAVITELADPISLPPAAGLVSPDRTSVRIVGRVLGEGDVLTTRLEPVPAVIDAIKAAYPAYRIHALNNLLANDEIQTLINGGLDDSLKLTIPLTFLILLVAFGAFVAAVIPLILAITALLAAFGILGLYSQAISPVSPYASQLVVLIGLAVAVDYSLFMVTRFRTERRHGRPKLAAIDVASNTAGRAVFFSGLAVMISIGGLFLLDDPLFRSMAV
ncbi:MAG: MMPL family transporter, partial [Candidatus Limnocylindrales bacterium]